MKKFKVTMWNPLYAYVEAKNKEDAILKASEENGWEGPIGVGFEKYDVEVIKNEKSSG